MIGKNLLRRKGRTILTVVGISIGVAAIILLGALAAGLEVGYTSMITGSNADLVLSQPGAFDVSYSSVDEEIVEAVGAMPEIAAIAPLLQGYVQAEAIPFFIVFGHPEDSFVLDRYQVIEGASLYSAGAQKARGKPVLLGSAAAEALGKTTGDTVRITGSTYRIVGIYETGDTLEDGGALLDIEEAQILLGKPRQVSILYIQLKDAALRERLATRIERRFPDLELSGAKDFAEQQTMVTMLQGYVWAIGGLAIVIGGVGMMNAQLMSVTERTREIGLLRAVGWTKSRVLFMILGESLLVSLLGGALGVALAWITLQLLAGMADFFGAKVTLELVQQALIIVLLLGLAGGAYPAWRASRLLPVEALRYEGGSSGGGARRLPVGGLAAQNLWQRSARTLLTLGAIGLTVGAIMSIEAVIRGVSADMTNMGFGADSEIMIRQADIADTSLSALDERVGDRIEAMPGVQAVSGMVMNAVVLPDSGGFFIMFGYAPSEYAIRRFNVVEGQPISGNRQIMIGRMISEALDKEVGETLELSGVRFRIAGIYESDVSWEEMGGVVSLRDAQNFAGRPRKVTIYNVKVHDPLQAETITAEINQRFPEAHAALTGEFVDQMPDMENADLMINTISILAIAVGGLAVLNTMLMSVLERTREVGILRALGWRRRGILGLILREALLVGVLGGFAGILAAFALTALMRAAPLVGDAFQPRWDLDVFARAITVALALGLAGGIYPAYRATRMQPVEALRYE